MQSFERMNTAQQEEDEPIEVSYTLLKASQKTSDDVLQKVGAAINVQLTLENIQDLPFIAPNGFDNVKHHDKLFIYGPSGCGKSRYILELIKDKLKNVENIFIINPRQTVGDESGRIGIRELINRVNQKDIVAWDNFPDDLLKRDVENGRKALEIISVKGIMSLLVALKPKYLEVYKGVTSKIPELYGHEITYDKETIKDIIRSYGKNIIQFIPLYEEHILPTIHQISTILWQKEPLPITVLAYYKELINKHREKKESAGPLDAALEAEKLMRRTEFYEHQFALINSLEHRQNDIEFLYTLKLCYELRLTRSPALIYQFQKAIFTSISPEVVYLNKELQKEVSIKIENNSEFSYPLV